MADLKIKRGYVVLPDNRVKFGIRVINTEDSALSEVEVILDFSRSLFELEGNMVEALGTIPPSIPRTAVFILNPLGCVHKEEIGATVRYRDHKWEKHTFSMRPKEVHCVCPFLNEKIIDRAEYLKLSSSGHSAEQGVNFENIPPQTLVNFLTSACKNRLYKVDSFSTENGTVLYLAGESIGEKACYLLTAVVLDRQEYVQVLLHASSDKPFGLHGFLNEILENLRHLVQNVRAAREIGYVKTEQVINIIDSVVQHTNFTGGTGETDGTGGTGGTGSPSVNIQDSVVQQTNFGSPEGQNMGRANIEKASVPPKISLAGQTSRNTQKNEHDILRITGKKNENTHCTFMLNKDFAPRKMLLVFCSILCLLIFIGWAMPGEEPVVPLPNTYTNSIGMEFVLISEGEFIMGSPDDEEGRWKDEGPVHKVTIEEPFYLGKYEVTQEQWLEVMGNNPSYFKGDNLPVESVSWNDVQEFIKKLNRMEGNDIFRLPSEAEWEYADRIGTGTVHSFGNDSSELEEYAWYGEGWDSGVTHPVGQKKPNPRGLYDMYGNVWEWTQDEYHESYEGAPSDGRVWVNGNASLRVFRGGSWFSFARDCRSAARYKFGPEISSRDLGFRLLRDP